MRTPHLSVTTRQRPLFGDTRSVIWWQDDLGMSAVQVLLTGAGFDPDDFLLSRWTSDYLIWNVGVRIQNEQGLHGSDLEVASEILCAARESWFLSTGFHVGRWWQDGHRRGAWDDLLKSLRYPGSDAHELDQRAALYPALAATHCLRATQGLTCEELTLYVQARLAGDGERQSQLMARMLATGSAA